MTHRREFDAGREFKISEQACDWTVRAISALRARLDIKVKMHHQQGQLETGEIFLFNHFARFETFIPQYLIHQETGAYCRSVASGEFFAEDNAFSRYLLSLGAVPNSYPKLLPFLADDILKGRKVIFFPEGGMVKDRRVIDLTGNFNIYSRTSDERRKHHAGAAVLALTLDAFKTGILENAKSGRIDQLERWTGILEMVSIDALLAAVRRPTIVVPSSITFYPIRVSDNTLKRGAELFARGLSPQLSEELLIEGNLLLTDTDMDIRLGDPISTHKTWSWVERRILALAIRRIDKLDDLFDAAGGAINWRERLVHASIRNHVLPMRDAYMRAMYRQVTVNLSHLASRLIMTLVGEGANDIDKDLFHKTLYLAVKNLQTQTGVYLHRGLLHPDAYDELLEPNSPPLEQFAALSEQLKLIERTGDRYRFLPKLIEESDFDRIRTENPIAVYANEIAPIGEAGTALKEARTQISTLDEQAMARLRFDDALWRYRGDRKTFTKSRYRQINDQETATADATPYMIVPGDGGNGLAVVLVHGFLASPAELRELGERLAAAGHPVIGVRLRGHGTSPHDLDSRTWRDWLASLRRGYLTIAAFAERVCIVGFSTGGALALIFAAQSPAKLAGVAVASTPLKFKNKNLIFVPLLHGANKLTAWMPDNGGQMTFLANDSEHPDINYRHIPVHGLYELRLAVAEMEGSLDKVTCPVLVLQGNADNVVEPESAQIIFRKLKSTAKALHMVHSNRHGILCEDAGAAQELVMDFLERLLLEDQDDRETKAGRVPLYPWESFYTGAARWHSPIRAKSLAGIFDAAAARFGERPCIEFLGRTYSYGEVAILIDRTAEGFRRMGVDKGDRVGICLPNTPFYVICYFAILKAGGTVVNINPLYAESEIQHLVLDSAMRIAVTLDINTLFSKISPLVDSGALKKVVVCNMRSAMPAVKGLLFSLLKSAQITPVPDDPRFLPFGELVDNDGLKNPPPIDPGTDIALLQYTGGTTGIPKGAMLTHANLSANTDQIRRLYRDMEDGQERILVILPLFHAFAMTVAMNLGIATGAELILLPRFEMKDALKTIEARRPTLFPGVPTLFSAIAAHPDVKDCDLSSIKACISGGAPLPARTKADFEALTGCQIVEGYGLSEASPVVACNPLGGVNKPGSIGIPLPGTVIDIRDPENPARILATGETGEICVRGPQVMAGYWQRPEETATALAGGVLHTGDLGYMDADGYTFLVDRQKDMILNGGYNVYPRVIEDAIGLHPDVLEVAVVGIPHATQGQVPKAFVTLKAGAPEDAAALKAFIKDKLSPMELPRSIEFRADLPKTLIGKLSKKDLLEQELASRKTAEHPQSQPES